MIVFRPAVTPDGAVLFNITRLSITELGKDHYTAQQLASWMGRRTPEFYATVVANGTTTVAEYKTKIVGYVQAELGERRCNLMSGNCS